MTQSTSLLLCYPSSFSVSSLPYIKNPFQHRFHSHSSVQLQSRNAYVRVHSYRRRLFPLQHAATQEITETCTVEIGFIEVGYVANVHGLQGEIRVKSDTDFPELRFSQPGRRWIKRKVLGRDMSEEVELVEGKGHPGQKSWILKFKGIDTVEQAKQLVGSVLLVREEDRPDLEEGEFYTRDLIGMKLIFKETGDPVGTVVNVFDSGANDLLQVRLDSSPHTSSINGDMKSSDKVASNPLVWVPFVEAIIPHVDVDRREMQITPPKGLLELNIRTDERSKKERRQIEWKERKKFQKRLIAAKKKLCELKQEHVFHGLRFGERPQRSLLSDHIVDLNSKLLQQALKNLEIPSKRWNRTEITSAMNSNLGSVIKISRECLTSGEEMKLSANFKFIEKGLSLTSKGKVGVVLVMNDSDNLKRECDLNFVDSEIDDSPIQRDQVLVKEEDRASVPLVIVSPAHKIQSLQLLFSDNDHFGFDSEKVLIFEEEKLPIIDSSNEEESKHKILMKTPWEILQSPVGSGGVLSLLSSHNILDKFSEMGVEYIKICSWGYNYAGSNSPLLGLVSDRQADVGIQLSKDEEASEENFYMVLSMNIMQKLSKQIEKLQFYAIQKLNPHVVMVDKEWSNLAPSSANSYELRSSIYSTLNACSFDKVCVLEITD